MASLSCVTRFLIERSDEAALDPGVVANGRLTASTGIVLTVLLLVEGYTILDVRGYITLHTVLGLLLIGPIALKSATTVYRFARYYAGRAAYVRRGAPPPALRIIGPFVILSSLAVLGTGIALIPTHGNSDTWITLHQASFIVWICLTGVHFLAHILEAVRGTARDLRRAPNDAAGRGRSLRWLSVTASLAVGIALAGAFTPAASSWQLHDHGERHAPGQIRP
jgi:hypothetical protein